MNRYQADLHIHSALSPCAPEEMTPAAIIAAARRAGLDLIAICDHNAAGNVAAVIEAAGAGTGRGAAGRPVVIPGVEITTAEEVHVVGLFPTAAAAEKAAAGVRATLPDTDASYTQRFGAQPLMTASGVVVGDEPKMLAMASTLALADAITHIHEHDGLAIAAHINRPSFSVLSQLGIFPAGSGFDAIEVFSPCGPGAQRVDPAAFTSIGLPIVASSDAHYPDDVGMARTELLAGAASFDELRLALSGAAGRRVAVVSG